MEWGLQMSKYILVADDPAPELLATDNRFNGDVSILFEDGSTIRFNSAFYEDRGEFYDIYTEHCGYFRLLKESIEQIGDTPELYVTSDEIRETTEKLPMIIALSFATGVLVSWVADWLLTWLK